MRLPDSEKDHEHHHACHRGRRPLSLVMSVAEGGDGAEPLGDMANLLLPGTAAPSLTAVPAATSSSTPPADPSLR
jgi:hypothetical protein